MPTFAKAFDVTKPLVGDLLTNGDDQIRDDKAAMLERLTVEHDFPTASGAGSGRHKFPFGTTAARPTDVVAGTVYYNTQIPAVEIWNGSAWVQISSAADATKLPLAGGTMSGAIVMPNNTYYQGKEIGGTVRSLLGVTSANLVQIGATQLPLRPFSSESLQWWDGSTNHTIWDEDNDGTGSGLDADKVRGLDADFSRSHAQNGYQKFPGGIIFEWGRWTVGGNATATVTLPLAFPSAFYTVFGSQFSNPDGRYENMSFVPISNSQFQIINQTPETVVCGWMAVGK